MHDIGKESATTIGGEPWKTATTDGKISAYRHQEPEHFMPQLEKLKDVAPKQTVDLYLQNQQLIDWLIQRHMDFSAGGFPKNVILKHFKDGKVIPSVEMKLLLILMWSDKMGRSPEDIIIKGIEENANHLTKSVDWLDQRNKNIANHITPPFAGSPEEFADMMNSKPMSRQQKIAATKGKFPNLSDEELNQLYN